jgi:hypothetical protein
MDTYAARRATRRTTGHYRRPGTDRSYCGHELDHTTAPADTFRAICKTCAKAEARDRAEAEAVADDHREGAAEQALAQSLAQSLTPKMRKVLPAVVAAGDFRDAGLANLPEGVTDPSLQALIRRGLAERYDSGETFVGFSGGTYKVMRYRATDLGRAVAAVLANEQAEAPTAQAAPVATNAFEQGAAGLLDAPRPGRYTLRVCEDPRDVCERGLCRTTSTRAAGTLDEVRAAAAMFRHAWPVDEHGNPVQDDDQAEADVAAVEDAEALYAAQLVTEADASDGTWRGEWIGERTTTTAPTLFDLDTEQGALFDDRATAAPELLGYGFTFTGDRPGPVWPCVSLEAAREATAHRPHLHIVARTAQGWGPA